MAKQDYFLLDSRAEVIALANDGKLETPDNGKYILVVDSLKECCKSANRGDYGDGCLVSDDQFNILWELKNEHGHWIPRALEDAD
jgi:hypothetical protein